MAKFLLILLVLLPVLSLGQIGIITTVAGNGTNGNTGNGGPAISAELGTPIGVVFDRKGNLYIACGGANIVRKVDTAGIITLFAGTGATGFSGDSGPAIAATFHNIDYVAVDAIGNIYISDAGNYRIRKVDTFGIITTFAGNGTTVFNGDTIPATSASIFTPQGLNFDKYGNLYVADYNHYRIRKIDTAGIITTVAGNGTLGFTGDSGLAINAKIHSPFSVIPDNFGNIYIADWGNNRIRKVDTAGIITTVAGNGAGSYSGDGIPATTAELNGPYAVSLDDSNNLFIADANNERVRKVSAITGIITTIAGTGVGGYNGDDILADTAKLHLPEGLAFDACGNLYIGDLNNFRVRKVTYPPTPITLTNAIAGSTADTVCGAMPVTFTATAAASSGVVTYQWYVNGSALSTTGNTYTYIPANGDSIRCVAMAANACTAAIASSNTINMAVNTVTTPTITITAPAVAAAGSVVSVNATVAGPASYSIRWYDNGVLFNTTTVPMVTYTKGAGVDNITATVVASEGCYDSSMSAVAIVTATTETSPSFGSAQDRLEVLRTFPNPVHNLLYVAIPNSPLGRPGEISYRLMSMVGSVMREGVLKEGDNMMWVEQIPVGVYMLELVDGDGGKTVRKIVKE